LLEIRRYRRDMAEIKREIQAGRHGHAARKLVALSAWKPDSDEAAYLLGLCEKARGQPLAAFQAWERVSPGSSFGSRAIRARMDLLIERGRLTDAENLILHATADRRFDGSEVRLFLGLLYSLEGRIEEGRDLIESCWDRLNEAGEGASERAIHLVRLHIQLWRETPSVDAVALFSIKSHDRPLTMIAPGWGKANSQYASACTMRPRSGLMPVCGGVPTISRSGAPGWIGRWRPVALRT
jgi:hypothetical protein